MGRQAAHGMDRGPDRHRLAEDMDQARAVDQPAAQRPLGLEAGDEDAAFAARQVLAQVVFDAAGIAHAAGRDDDRATGPEGVNMDLNCASGPFVMLTHFLLPATSPVLSFYTAAAGRGPTECVLSIPSRQRAEHSQCVVTP